MAVRRVHSGDNLAAAWLLDLTEGSDRLGRDQGLDGQLSSSFLTERVAPWSSNPSQEGSRVLGAW